MPSSTEKLAFGQVWAFEAGEPFMLLYRGAPLIGWPHYLWHVLYLFEGDPAVLWANEEDTKIDGAVRLDLPEW